MSGKKQKSSVDSQRAIKMTRKPGLPPGVEVEIVVPERGTNKKTCKFGAKCKRLDCWFTHPKKLPTTKRGKKRKRGSRGGKKTKRMKKLREVGLLVKHSVAEVVGEGDIGKAAQFVLELHRKS